VVPDLTFGVAQYDDYNFGGYGTGEDKPFILLQQQTSDDGAAQRALDTMPLHSGSDWQESTYEALYQAASGKGYDQNCDGDYDSEDDVRPLISTAAGDDAFRGMVMGTWDELTPGTGSLGGMAFRADASKVIVYATDAPPRDPDLHGAPGGCAFDATEDDAVAALNTLDANVIGVGVNMSASSDGYDQMTDLALQTDSFFDLDSDGLLEPAVFTWSSSDAVFRATVTDAIISNLESTEYDSVSLVVVDDPTGAVLGITPSAYIDVTSGTALDFQVHLDGVEGTASDLGAEEVQVRMIADSTVVLDTYTLYVLP